jgi:hypothetical protein
MEISATLTKDRHDQPLVVSAPFNGLEIRPTDLRQLAQQLNALADAASTRPGGPKHWKPLKVTSSPIKNPLDHVFEGMATHLKSQLK